MRKIIVIALATLVVAQLGTASAQPSARGTNSEHGFSPERMYQFSEMDSVNLFNGNVVISVPIGIRYPVNRFSYQLALHYNSKVWWFRGMRESNSQSTSGCNVLDCAQGLPHPQSNAGLGWRLSLGRLFYGSHPMAGHASSWIYEGPTGETHVFSDPTSNTAPGAYNAPVMISEDVAKLRLVETSGKRIVEFGNGERHTFERMWYTNGSGVAVQSTSWRLSRIEDRHGNSLDIAYVIDARDADVRWTLVDSIGRTHYVHFTHKASMETAVSLWKGQTVASIDLEAARTAAGAARRAVYTFDYDEAVVEWPCGHQLYASNATSETRTRDDNREGINRRALLTRVGLPDGTGFSFTHHPSGTTDGTCGQGAMQTMTVPTGATTAYAYQRYLLPVGSLCAGEDAAFEVAPTVGLASKTVTIPGTTSATWNYFHQTAAQHTPVPGSADEKDLCIACGGDKCAIGKPWLGESGPLVKWSRTTVLAPPDTAGARTRTDHFFNLWFNKGPDGDYLGPEPHNDFGFGYGVPMTNAAPAPALSMAVGPDVETDVGGRYLSTRTYDGCNNAGTCTALRRSTYVSYAFLDSRTAIQLDSTRTVHEDDSGCGGKCWTQTTSRVPNGVGRWKTTSVESNYPKGTPASYGPHTETVDTTEYSTWTGADMTNPARQWLLDTYTWRSHLENGQTTYTYSCFDPTTGFLTKVRTLASPSGQTFLNKDLVTTFSSHYGLVAQANYYGGDKQSISTANDCAAPAAAPEYSIRNAYSGGVLAKSEYLSGTSPILVIRDLDIDPSTGLATKSRDSAGTETAFAYDDKPARIDSMTAPTGLTTTYRYTNATASSLARVEAITGDLVNPRLKSTFDFDGLGRVVRTTSLAPPDEGTQPINVIVETAFDALGRRAKISEPYKSGATPLWTEFTYDAFGRQTSTKTPDGKTTATTYTGERLGTHTTKVALSVLDGGAEMNLAGTESDVSVEQDYDALGRLVRVTERSGPPAPSNSEGRVSTQYGYDFGGRLTSVLMTGSEGTAQRRNFLFDPRGFLTYESHPESTTKYENHDSRGHAGLVLRGTTSTVFDQELVYDAAERLVKVRARNPFNVSTFRDLKEFSYGENGATATVPGRDGSALTSRISGRLVTASRWNYDPLEATLPSSYDVLNIKVTETYDYTDGAGRVTARRTKFERVFDGVPGPPFREVRVDMAYDDLGLRTQTAYPVCSGCSYPVGTVGNAYVAGRLRSSTITPAYGMPAASIIDAITYHPNAMMKTLEHGNGMDDQQTLADGMARPGQITFGQFSRCTNASVSSISYSPVKTTYNSGETVTFNVVAGGTGPFTYYWYKDSGSGWQYLGSTQNPTFTLDDTATYWVRVVGTCGFAGVESPRQTLTVVACQATAIPSTVPAAPDSNPTLPSITIPYNTSTTLSVNVSGTAPVDTKWYRGEIGDETNWLAAGTSYSTGNLTSSRRYWAKVSNSCTVASKQFAVTVPLPQPIGLAAVRSGSGISVTWTAAPSAARYQVWRLHNGGAWTQIGETTSTNYVDAALTNGSTYAYRVRAVDANGGSESLFSNHDSATLLSFSTVTPGTAIDDAYFHEILTAVNSVRAASGLPALTWAQALPPNTAAPANGGAVLAEYVITLRTRMAEALQVLGVAVRPVTDPALTAGFAIRAIYLTDLQHLVD